MRTTGPGLAARPNKSQTLLDWPKVSQKEPTFPNTYFLRFGENAEKRHGFLYKDQHPVRS